jgi:hypothetical protein
MLLHGKPPSLCAYLTTIAESWANCEFARNVACALRPTLILFATVLATQATKIKAKADHSENRSLQLFATFTILQTVVTPYQTNIYSLYGHCFCAGDK